MEQKKRDTLLGVLFIGVLMGALDIAIVGPALPAIRSYFGISGSVPVLDLQPVCPV
ncbi:MAG: hypothetical protein AB9891_04435 [Anaerolineaceae bacterium]